MGQSRLFSCEELLARAFYVCLRRQVLIGLAKFAIEELWESAWEAKSSRARVEMHGTFDVERKKYEARSTMQCVVGTKLEEQTGHWLCFCSN